MSHRAAFYRPASTTSGLGPEQTGWAATAFHECWARFRPERGKEVISAGRVESRKYATLMLRNCAAARSVTVTDSAVIDGRRWNIRSVEIEATDRSQVHLVLEAGQ